MKERTTLQILALLLAVLAFVIILLVINPHAVSKMQEPPVIEEDYFNLK